MSETVAERQQSTGEVDNPITGIDIDLVGVTKRYPGQKRAAVEPIDLHIPAGEIAIFIGPSGCGKTTSLKMINRLIEPSGGKILLGGEDSTTVNENELRRKIGYVIQGGSLFPHLTVADNIGLVPGLLKWDKKRISDRVDELLELVSLDPKRYRNRYPRELSGGQQQRVGVARGLAADPPVILMDEPFGAVDPITRQRLQDELMSIQEELRKTIVCVTHDIDEAIKLGDRILILAEGAQIQQYDTPEAILAAPANDFVADFVGAGSSLKQLSLSRVSDIELSQPTTATIGESAADALSRAQTNRDKAVIVLDSRRRPRDWVWLRELKSQDRITDPGDDEINTVDRRATLNDALDTMLADSHAGAIVTGRRDEYLGVINFEKVTEHMVATTAQVQAEQEESGPDQPNGTQPGQDQPDQDQTGQDQQGEPQGAGA
ncbi:ABC transporter ATP-binding protein [Microlunatus soli]|uniref:ABC-type quaternary amine transporter n=1 Tax=Microlunatus soli TaxID=630515 RepID=A0A1H1UJB8_9ACTN|nr:ABC transporter ATP-binding protein [Microlunatus soli]SDS72575.1 osmoprotectant transport system ATP-binding protein [Microlunatus soli]